MGRNLHKPYYILRENFLRHYHHIAWSIKDKVELETNMTVSYILKRESGSEIIYHNGLSANVQSKGDLASEAGIRKIAKLACWNKFELLTKIFETSFAYFIYFMYFIYKQCKYMQKRWSIIRAFTVISA